jgi:hypothetical protein
MFLFNIILMLLSQESIQFKFADFVPNLTTVNRSTGDLLTLGVGIKGKSDESSKNLIIHRNIEIPELCLIRHLLGWIHLTGKKDGYLFSDRNGRPFRYKTLNASYSILM